MRGFEVFQGSGFIFIGVIRSPEDEGKNIHTAGSTVKCTVRFPEHCLDNIWTPFIYLMESGRDAHRHDRHDEGTNFL